MHRFKELNIWKQGRILAVDIYTQTKDFPSEEKFGLISQLRRAGVSIPSNIAEGASRHSNKDFSRFIEIAIGSAFEIETQLIIAKDLDYLDSDAFIKLETLLQRLIRQLVKFKTSLNN